YYLVHARYAGGGNGGALALGFGDPALQVHDAAFGGDVDGARGYVFGVDEGGDDLGTEPGVVGTHAGGRDGPHTQLVDDARDLVDLLSRGARLLLVVLGGDIAQQQNLARVGMCVDAHAGCFCEDAAHLGTDLHFNGLVFDLFTGGAPVGCDESRGCCGTADHQGAAAGKGGQGGQRARGVNEAG